MTAMAARAGKDVYCEKPLSLTIPQGRAMVDVIHRHQRILQTGSQLRSGPKIRRACELVRNGRIGKARSRTPLRCRTSKGAHFYFRHPGTEVRNGRHLLGRPIDVRGDGGYVVTPPSIHPETLTPYEWLPTNDAPWQCGLDDLPMFDPNWLEAKSPRVLPSARRLPSTLSGHAATSGELSRFPAKADTTRRSAPRAAGRSRMHGAADAAAHAGVERNERGPKWTEAEIRHKVRDALSRGASDATADSQTG